MPGHRCSHSDFEAKVAELEQQGEEIVDVHGDDGGLYIVTKSKVQRRKPGQTETR